LIAINGHCRLGEQNALLYRCSNLSPLQGAQKDVQRIAPDISCIFHILIHPPPGTSDDFLLTLPAW
jgi:hypothetical protein